MKAKKTIITLAFAFLMLGIKAQTEYKYSSVIYMPKTAAYYSISISKEGKYETSEGKISEGNASINTNPVIEVLNKMSNEGWEVFNNNVVQLSMGLPTYYFFLRKKK